MKEAPRILTLEDKRQLILRGEDVPTMSRMARKKVYIAKTRGTIFGENKKALKIKIEKL